jgi:RNA polymerase sigma factor (sigma-70 family)
MRDMGRFELLTAGEEIDLAIRARAGDYSARDRLINCNLRLAFSRAKIYQNRGLQLPDLVGHATVGLITAVDKFDPERGLRFSTMAIPWIDHVVSRAIDNEGKLVRLPVHVLKKIRRIKAFSWEFVAQNGRSPSSKELREPLSLDEESEACYNTENDEHTAS